MRGKYHPCFLQNARFRSMFGPWLFATFLPDFHETREITRNSRRTWVSIARFQDLTIGPRAAFENWRIAHPDDLGAGGEPTAALGDGDH